MADDSPFVRVQRAAPVTTLVLDSPANRNALSSRLLAELVAGLDEARRDEEVRVVVLTGTGGTFCSGLDLSERLHPPGGAPTTTIADVLTAIVSMPKPVVGRVNGHVRAGGMGLVAACDLVAAPEDATFAFTEVRVGVAPAIIAVPVLQRVDARAWQRWALTGEVFGARDARAGGLLSDAVDDLEALDVWTSGMVASLLRCSPAALAATKGLTDLGGRPWTEALRAAEELSDSLFASADAAEGMAAFLEKRPPSWVAGWGG